MLTLGIDAGGTATRWQLREEGKLVAEGQGLPMSGHLFNDEVRKRSLAALDAILADVRDAGQPAAVCAGITGLSQESEAAQTYIDLIAEGLDLPRDRVRVVDDMWIAYLAAFQPGKGILVYCGTGSVGYHIAEGGRVERAGGHGYIIDDGGSAFWIARMGVHHLMRAVDERGASAWNSPLGSAFAKRFGGARWDLVRSTIYSGDRGSIAGLAPAVAEAAEAGDAVALKILGDAGAELARLGLVLANRTGPLPVVLIGGGFKLHPAVTAGVKAALPPDMPVTVPGRPAVEAAAELAAAL
ncbi:N-acetylglucosamine kinase [Lacibacterium aquatile]|uniref:N-acetylglucosamine kinase n=1 Tax=Lacibacterium aquatile TaxID=1168082 RepID=A0ABW5DV32_9PROT